MSRRAIITILALFALVATIVLLLPQRAMVKNFPPHGSTVVVLGDSIAAGVGASASEKGFVSVLSARLNTPIVNAGKSGDTTADGLARFETDVLAHDPDIVVIELGGNDHLKRVPPEQTFENLGALVAQAQAKGAVVIVLGIRGGLFADGFDDRFEALAETCGCVFVPDILSGIFGDGRSMADAVHPNDRGHEKIADKVAPVLEGILVSVVPANDGSGAQ